MNTLLTALDILIRFVLCEHLYDAFQLIAYGIGTSIFLRVIYLRTRATHHEKQLDKAQHQRLQ